MGHFSDVRDFQAAGDLAAIVEAGDSVSGQIRELWHQERRVLEFPALTAPEQKQVREFPSPSRRADPLASPPPGRGKGRPRNSTGEIPLQVLKIMSPECELYHRQRVTIEHGLAAKSIVSRTIETHLRAAGLHENLADPGHRAGHPPCAEPPEPANTPLSGSMPSLSQLRREHAELASLARHLAGMIAQSVPPEAGKLYELRMKLTSALICHLKAEDWVLYPCLLRSSNEQVVTTARAFSASMGELANDFHDYVRRWGATEIGDDWEGYQRETSEILRVLTLRMKRENRDLYPLLDDVEG